MENNEKKYYNGGSEKISGERIYALLYKLYENARDVEIQVRALGRRLDELINNERQGEDE